MWLSCVAFVTKYKVPPVCGEPVAALTAEPESPIDVANVSAATDATTFRRLFKKLWADISPPSICEGPALWRQRGLSEPKIIPICPFLLETLGAARRVI